MGKQFIILNIDSTSGTVAGMGVATLGMATVEVPQEVSFLDSAYQLLDCDLVDVLPVMINGQKVDVWFDQDFLANGAMPVHTSLVFNSLNGHEVPVFGPVLLAGSGDDGDAVSVGVTSEEIRGAIDEQKIRVGHMKKIVRPDGNLGIWFS